MRCESGPSTTPFHECLLSVSTHYHIVSRTVASPLPEIPHLLLVLVFSCSGRIVVSLTQAGRHLAILSTPILSSLRSRTYAPVYRCPYLRPPL